MDAQTSHMPQTRLSKKRNVVVIVVAVVVAIFAISGTML